MMKWASTVSENPDLKKAIGEVAKRVRAELKGATPDLLIAFVSPEHQADWEDVPSLLSQEFPGSKILGSSGGGVIGGGEEIERKPGFSLTAAVLPGVEVTPIWLENDDLPTLRSDRKTWEKLLGISFEKNPHFLLLPDPFTFDAEALLEGLDAAFPWSKKIGGMASGGRDAGENILFLDGEFHREGAVLVGLSGNIMVDTIVAQGCRPIGVPMFVTQCDQNLLLEVDGRPPTEVLKELYLNLEPRDQDLFRNSLFLGVVMKPSQPRYAQGDFLIRNLVGMDPQSRALAIGAFLQENWVVQFHLRDAQTSAEDLDELLSRFASDLPIPPPQGALLFSCMGRGEALYLQPNHDSKVFARHLGPLPLGGFFCNGEIGPVHGKTFLHGYTSCFGLFRPRSL
ncbi:MAG: FIST N-terminal domain-containing protein [bacterium]